MIHLSLSIQNLNKIVKKKIETHFSLKNTLTTCYVHTKKSAEIGETGATLRVYSRWQDSTLYCCECGVSATGTRVGEKQCPALRMCHGLHIQSPHRITRSKRILCVA